MASRQPFSATDYHNDPRRRAKSAFVRAAGRALRPLGFDLELSHYYSPIPQAGDRPAAWWEQPGELPGVAFEAEAQLAFIERELGGHIAEFRPPRTAREPTTYHLDNGLFGPGDADLLYAMVRRFKPARVIEFGAGFSTLVSSLAVEANRREGHETRLTAFDPYAVAPPPGAVPGLRELRPVAAEDVPAGEYAALGPGDVVFIDSSHTVKVGGDVVHLLTEVLPRLPAGVLVHLHDIYLPWPYPRAWVARNRWYWAEQYLLQALLCESARWEILVAAHALSRTHGEALRALIPHLWGAHPPLSFWLRRSGEA
jgi:hypothetical protein